MTRLMTRTFIIHDGDGGGDADEDDESMRKESEEGRTRPPRMSLRFAKSRRQAATADRGAACRSNPSCRGGRRGMQE